MAKQLTTGEAAKRLGVGVRRVQALIANGDLRATKIGRDWLIDESDLAKVERRPQGYPKGRPRAKSE